MRTALRTIASLLRPGSDELSLPWHLLDFAHTSAIRSHLAERFAPATGNRMLAAMRGVLRAAFRLGLLSADQMTRACAVEPVRGLRLPKGRALSAGELRALFETCDSRSPTGARNAAVLGVLYGAGLRRAELCALEVAHYNPESGRLVVNGKGRKQRSLFVPEGSRQALAAWLSVRGIEPGPLFHPLSKGGTVQRRRMTPGAVAQIAERLARRAKVAAFSPHDMRRTCIGDKLDKGVDICTVQAEAGHASPMTTSSYDRRGDRAKQRSAELLHVPFVWTAAAGEEA
jgi:integrase